MVPRNGQPTDLPNQQQYLGVENVTVALVIVFPQRVVFRGLGLLLHGKQVARNPSQPRSSRAPDRQTGSAVPLCSAASSRRLETPVKSFRGASTFWG